MSLTIGVDVGGTKIAAGVVDDDGNILASLRRPSPTDSADELRTVVTEIVTSLRADHDVTALGLSAAGAVTADRRHVQYAPHLVWGEEPVADRLGAETGLPVVIENDGNAAAWAEHRFGAGQQLPDMLMIAVGTGVGGGVVLRGELVRGGHGFAAEVGHIAFVPGGLPCPCGRRGCWEQYASGNALVRRAQEAARRGNAAGLLDRAGGDVDAITGHLVTEAASDDDREAIAVFDALGYDLGTGIASIVAVVDPSLVVLGGGVSDAGELLRGPAERGLRAELTGGDHRHPPPVVLAHLGNDAAIVGVADLARRPS